MKTKYLNQAAMAKELHISLTTLQNWRRKGCPCKSENGQILFELKTVQKWRQEHKEKKLENSKEYRKARAKRERYKANLAELEYQEKAGLLVPVAQVEKEAEDLYRNYRDRMLNVVIRASKKLLGETNEFKFRQVLKNEIESATIRICILINGRKI